VSTENHEMFSSLFHVTWCRNGHCCVCCFALQLSGHKTLKEIT
jgi:hypothetical protein